jgi:hypothetical protein
VGFRTSRKPTGLNLTHLERTCLVLWDGEGVAIDRILPVRLSKPKAVYGSPGPREFDESVAKNRRILV